MTENISDCEQWDRRCEETISRGPGAATELVLFTVFRQRPSLSFPSLIQNPREAASTAQQTASRSPVQVEQKHRYNKKTEAGKKANLRLSQTPSLHTRISSPHTTQDGPIIQYSVLLLNELLRFAETSAENVDSRLSLQATLECLGRRGDHLLWSGFDEELKIV